MASSQEHELAQTLQALEFKAVALVDEVRQVRQQWASQARRIAQLEHENHALHLALRKIKEVRANDRKAIEMWREYSSQGAPPSEPPTTDALTQEGATAAAAPPSSPPLAALTGLPHSSQYQDQHPNSLGLSQRVLPLSIDVDELYEDQTKAEKSSRAASPTSEPEIADEERITSSQSEADADARSVPAKRSATERSAASQEFKRSLPSSQRSESFPIRSTSKQLKISDVLSHVWHPSEFIPNPKPSTGGPRVSHAYIEVVRNKSRRRCMHGTNCKSCEAFYNIVGQDAIAKSSRHRGDFSQQETPAGFWRTEFPDSLDAREDQLEARAQWVAEGRKRAVEAINQGRYLFKDKDLREKIRLQLFENDLN